MQKHVDNLRFGDYDLVDRDVIAQQREKIRDAVLHSYRNEQGRLADSRVQG